MGRRQKDLELTVEVFVPDGKGGIVNWDDLTPEEQDYHSKRICERARVAIQEMVDRDPTLFDRLPGVLVPADYEEKEKAPQSGSCDA